MQLADKKIILIVMSVQGYDKIRYKKIIEEIGNNNCKKVSEENSLWKNQQKEKAKIQSKK